VHSGNASKNLKLGRYLKAKSENHNLGEWKLIRQCSKAEIQAPNLPCHRQVDDGIELCTLPGTECTAHNPEVSSTNRILIPGRDSKAAPGPGPGCTPGGKSPIEYLGRDCMAVYASINETVNSTPSIRCWYSTQVRSGALRKKQNGQVRSGIFNKLLGPESETMRVTTRQLGLPPKYRRV
jgi:hypothetical protein